MTGTYSNRGETCLKCSAGGFYQDEMGQLGCKNCSTGTYVPETHHPGKSATDCRACPYTVPDPTKPLVIVHADVFITSTA
ncbi:hypothetical protein OS493_016869 [Desmophyllum pertusum]|uniref:Tyrosine-protein kinase ephrin type A/B receptor-like domain-containing protein n=1 Tax=Desmophyllum pertusum TaxID=174260 RepID=A0A9W9YPY3_9CNID|nr:hypothetical protein OS493_016869 [Desmophyllum pertusum]